MLRSCTVIAIFLARMITAAFDLGTPQPPAGPQANILVNREAAPAPSPTIISGLPEDAGTLRR